MRTRKEGIEHDVEFNELNDVTFDELDIEAYSPQDPLTDSPEVMRSLLNKQRIDHLIDSFLRWHHSKGASSDAALVRTFRTIKAACRNYIQDFHKCNLTRDNQRNAASTLVLNAKEYPIELRTMMLKAFDEQQYEDVIQLAASFDMKKRERPNAGKKGPDDPLKVRGDIHIDWDQVAKRC